MNLAKRDYKECVKEEIGTGLKKIYRIKTSASSDAINLIRKSQYFYNRGGKLRKILSNYYRRKLQAKYGIFVNPKKRIGKGLRIGHANGIIIGTNGIGENCTIYQQVTIGSAHIGDAKKGLQPEIGNNCVFFAGSKILGNIKVADGTIVGANAVLTKSTEANSTYVGIPAHKVIKK